MLQVILMKFTTSLFRKPDQFRLLKNLLKKYLIEQISLNIFHYPDKKKFSLTQKGIKCHYLIEGSYKIIYEYLDDKKLIVILDVFNTNRHPENILKE